MDFLNGSFKVGRLFDIDIRVHILFVIWIAYQLITAGGDYAWTAGFLGLLFGIVLIHEFGHCFGARSVGGDAKNILMWPLGGLAYAHAPMTPWAQFVTVAAGPLVNLVFCIISGAIVAVQIGTVEPLLLNPFMGIYFPGPEYGWLGYTFLFYEVNLLLLAFNLLPIYPLDGGQLFQCALWPFLGLHRAIEIACKVGLVGCVGLFLWGMSPDSGRMLILIAVFGGFTCWQRLQHLRYGMVVDERIKYAPYKQYNPRKRSLWSRLFGRKYKVHTDEDSYTAYDADAGDEDQQYSTSTKESAEERRWRKQQEEQQQLEAEVDRILKKVSDRGLHSLSYIEKQTLERARRMRQKR